MATNSSPLFQQPLTKGSWAGLVTLSLYMTAKIGIKEYLMDKFLKIHYQPEDKLLRWKVMPNKSALIDWHIGHAEILVRSPRRWSVKPCMAGEPPPFPHSPLHRSGLYIYIGSALWNIGQILRKTASLCVRYHRALCLGRRDDRIRRISQASLTSRSQHVSWSCLESSEVTKGTILPFDPSAFSAIELQPLPLSARMQKKKWFSAKIGFLQHFLNDKTSFWLFGKKMLIAKLVKGNIYKLWSFQFFQIAVLNENMTKFTCLLWISGTCCALSQWIITTN